MEGILLASTLILALATLYRMTAPGIRFYFRMVIAAFFMVGLASVGWCDDLTTTAAAVLAFDYHHATPQNVALLLLVIGGFSMAGLWGGKTFEKVLENWIMDHVPGGSRIKTCVPLALAIAGAYILNVSTGLSLAASLPGAIVLALKSMAVHASDAGTTSAAQAAKDENGGK